MDFLLKAISTFAGNFLSGLISSVLTGVSEIFQKYVYLFITDSLVTTAQKAVVGISIPLIVLFTIKQYFDVYIMETSGDPESDPLDVLVRGAQAIAVVCCSSWIFYTFMNFCSAFAENVISVNQVNSLMSNFTESVNILKLTGGSNGFIGIIFLTAMLIGIFAFYVIAVIRAAQLAIMFVILPLFATELTHVSKERFQGLITNIIVTGLYFVLQLLLFKFFVSSLGMSMTDIVAKNDPDTFMLDEYAFKAIGFCIAMLQGPKWLDKFIYNSGVGDTAKRTTGSLVQTAITWGMKVK